MIFARVEAAGQLDNTYFVFMSDNGWLYGQHRLKSKGYPYEEAIRVPLVISIATMRPPRISGTSTSARVAMPS